jgi:tRNA (Thr-GGU) A37 N-methylase
LLQHVATWTRALNFADPQQLHATIKDCSPPSPNAIGTVVFAIFKIESGTLTLAEVDGSDEPPKTFSSASSRYVVKKVQPQMENAKPPKTK